MKRTLSRWLLATMLVVGGATHHGLARASSAALQPRYVDRSLALPYGTLRIDSGPHWPFWHPAAAPFRQGLVTVTHLDGVDTWWHINGGVTLSPVRNLEVGLLLPLMVAPDLDLGDPVAHALLGLSKGSAELGLMLAVALPVEGDFQMWGGVPLRFHIGSPLRLDFGAFLRLDPGNNTQVDLVFPLELAIQATPEVFLGPETGLAVLDFDGVDVPLGFVGGYTIGTDSGTLGDLAARFRLHDVDDGVSGWQLIATMDFHFDL